MNHLVQELPFVIHGLFMKKFMNLFMTPHRKVHEPYDMVRELAAICLSWIIHENVHELGYDKTNLSSCTIGS